MPNKFHFLSSRIAFCRVKWATDKTRAITAAEYFEESCHALHADGRRIFFKCLGRAIRHPPHRVRFYFRFVTDSTDNNSRTVHSSTASAEERVEFLHRAARSDVASSTASLMDRDVFTGGAKSPRLVTVTFCMHTIFILVHY